MLLKDMLSDEHPPLKLLPMSLRGRISTYPHTFLVRLEVNEKSMFFLDSCTSNDGINTEREERLGQLREALARHDSEWAEVKWAEWGGWGDGGVPQQENDADCLLLTWYNAAQLAAGAAKGVLPPQVALRGLAMRLLVLHIIRSPLLSQPGVEDGQHSSRQEEAVAG